MLERFLGDRHVAAAGDHHLLHAPVLEHRHVRQHLGVTAFVARRQLHDVVEHQHASVALGVEDLDVLKLALFLDERLSFDLDRLRETGMQFFQETCSPSGRSFAMLEREKRETTENEVRRRRSALV